MNAGRYHAAVTTGDVWICYPWEAKYVPIYSVLRMRNMTNFFFSGILTSTMNWLRSSPSIKYLWIYTDFNYDRPLMHMMLVTLHNYVLFDFRQRWRF
jgi:hypothetical protein